MPTTSCEPGRPPHFAKYWSATAPTRRRHGPGARAVVGCIALVALLARAAAAGGFDLPTREDFIDGDDGYLDVSKFLDRAYGFVPLVVPITEPAVGYGAAGALLFIDRRGEPGSESFKRPNVYAAGALRTDNGTRGTFAGGTGRLLDGRLQLDGGIADADLHLDFYAAEVLPLGYTAKARGGLVAAKLRLGDTPWWAGLRYGTAKVDVRFDTPRETPGDLARDQSLRLAAIAPTLTYDSRDNLFTPTRGLFLDIAWSIAAGAMGSDRNFQRVDALGIAFHPLGDHIVLGAKAGGRWASDGTPFYLRPFVQMRGIQALRYQGDGAGELEVEARWQFHPRFAVVGFGGVGFADGGREFGPDRETVTAGGGGLRYLLARSYGLQMGIDVARGPDQTIWYVVFGNGWFRP